MPRQSCAHTCTWAPVPKLLDFQETLCGCFQFLEEVSFDPAIAGRCCSKANEEQGWAPTANAMRITSDNLNQILGKPPKWEVLTYSHPIKTAAGPIRSPDAAPPPLRQLRQVLGGCSPREREHPSAGLDPDSWHVPRGHSTNWDSPLGMDQDRCRLWMSLGDEHPHHLRIY